MQAIRGLASGTLLLLSLPLLPAICGARDGAMEDPSGMPNAVLGDLRTSGESATPIHIDDDPPTGTFGWFKGAWFSVLAKAKAEERRIVILVYGEGSTWSDRMVDETFGDARVQEEFASDLCVRVEGGSSLGQKLAQRFPVSIYPTLIFLRSDGSLEEVISGFIAPEALRGSASRIRLSLETLGYWRDRQAADPEDLEARYWLAQQLFDLGDLEGYQLHDEYIRAADPEGRSIPLRRERLQMLQEELFGVYRETQTVDVDPILTYLAEEQHDRVAYEGWTYLAGAFPQLGQPERSRDAWRKAHGIAPAERRYEASIALAGAYWGEFSALDSADRALGLQAAREAVQRIEERGVRGPHYIGTLDLLARWCVRSDRAGEARELWSRCERAEPGLPLWGERRVEFLGD